MKGWTPGVRRVWLLRSVALVALPCSLGVASSQAQAAAHTSKLKLSASLPKQFDFGTSETIKAKVGGSASALRGTHLEVQSLTGQKVKAVAKASLRGPGKAKLTVKPTGTGLQTLRIALFRGRKLLAKTKPKDVFITHDTEAIDPAKVISAPPSGEAGQIVYSGDPNLSPGDFVATGVGEATPSGMLGLVSSSKTSGGKTVVSTTPADLIDALPKGSIDVDQELSEQTIAIGEEEVSESEGRRIARGTFNCGTGAKLQVSGSVSLQPRVSFTAKWGFLKVSSARFESGVTVTSNLTVKAIGSASCSISRKQLGQFYLKPIDIQVGYVPVILVPRVALYLSGDGTVSADVTTGVTGSITGSAGISYANGRYSPIGRFQPSFSYSPPQVTNRAHLGASTSPELDLLLYGVAGPSVFVEGGLDFTATLGADPWWTLDAPVSVGARLVVPSLGLMSGDLSIYKRSFRLAQASGGGPGGGGGSTGQHTLTVSVSGDGSVSGPGISCPGDCSESVEDGTHMSLTASSDAGSTFSGWGGDCSGASACDLTIDADRSVEADFQSDPGDPGTWKALSTSGTHTCGIDGTGQAYCWGSNPDDYLGIGSAGDQTTPAPVVGLGNAREIASGEAHSCAIRAGGQAVCWGWNDDGQLGDGTTEFRATPVPVVGLNDAKKIVASHSDTCALRRSGQVVCWGNNYNFFVDNTSLDDYSSVPVPVPHLDDAKAISMAGIGGTIFVGLSYLPHACAIRESGQAVCWGNNSNGQLGDGTTQRQFTPVNVNGLTDATEISVGLSHACAVRASGQAVCWGLNHDGQLGDGSGDEHHWPSDSLVPVPVAGLGDAASIAAAGGAGGNFTCAARLSGDAVCWGDNYAGALGIGDPDTWRISTPLQVQGLHDAVTVTAGAWGDGGHACAIRSNGETVCWGSNYGGELGDGTTVDRYAPVPVVGH